MPASQPTGVRLRQAVLVAEDLQPAQQRLRDVLGLKEPFRDPNVALFGLENTVFSLGENFIEIVSPTTEGTAAGRQLERQGDGGYMLIFQVDDLEDARERALAADVRIAWEIDLEDISTVHLHPADIGGTILSIDRPLPPESWRWGGPDWTGQTGEGAPGRLTGVTVRVPEPEAVVSRWAEVLGLDPDGTTLHLDRNQTVSFEAGDEGLAEITVELPDGEPRHVDFGAARVVIA